jgi:endonuclease YncB( thermonuclease family)
MKETLTPSPWNYLLLTVCAAAIFFAAPVRAEIVSYAIVRDNATLRIMNNIIHLFGIYIPSSSQLCGFESCAKHAARALEFKIQGFVHCYEKRKHRDGSITALCYYDGEDLGAYLIGQGWALANSGIPEYRVLEKLARHQSRGMWARIPLPYRY